MNYIMLNWLADLLRTEFMPHGMCYMWNPATLWANVLGDGFTALAYFLIPGLLIYFVNKRPDIEMKGVFFGFAAFIISCGLVHVLTMVNVWIPLYNLTGAAKILMAVVSLGTVALLYIKMPEALELPTPAILEKVNEQLREEIRENEELRKELEAQKKELSKTVNLLMETQETARIGSWEVDVNEMTCYWSDMVYAIHEVETGTPIAVEDGISYYREDFQPIIEKAVNEGIEQNKGWDEECVLVTAKGNEIWVRAIGYPVFEEGKVSRLRGLFMDIDSQKRSQLQREVDAEQLRTFIKQAPTAIAMFDKDMKYLVASNQWYKDYGLEGEEIIYRSHYELFPNILDMPEWLDFHKRAQSGEVLEKDRDYYVHEDGSEQWIKWKLTPWFLNQQEQGGIIMYTEDVTAKVKYEEWLQETNTKLESEVAHRTRDLSLANNELEAFSYSVSHDLRAPLRAIHGFSGILLEDYSEALDREGVRLLNVVKANSVKMGRLIDDILAFSRLGRKDIKNEVIDMNWMVKVVVREISRSYEDDHYEVETGDLPKVSGDLTMIQQVLYNLISNAFKYSSKNALIRISIQAEVADDEVQFSIRDNGTGFDMEYYDKLFGVFQRLHSNDDYEGTGVGLAIVKRTIEKHGGKIWAESEPGKGATFYFTLNKAKEVNPENIKTGV